MGLRHMGHTLSLACDGPGASAGARGTQSPA